MVGPSSLFSLRLPNMRRIFLETSQSEQLHRHVEQITPLACGLDLLDALLFRSLRHHCTSLRQLHTDMSSTRSGSFRRSLHSDSVPKRPGTSTSTVLSVIATLDNVHEDSEEEEQAARFLTRHSRSLHGSVLDKINPSRWNHLPRLSTTCDLPFLDFPKDHSVARIDSLKFSNDELLETYSNGHSSDEESIVQVKSTPETTSTPESSGKRSAGLRRAMSSSSIKLKRMGSRLRRVPSNLLARSINRDPTTDSPLQTKSLPVTPVQQVSKFFPCLHSPSNPIQENQTQEVPRLRRSISRVLSRTFLRTKENDKPEAA